MKKLIVLSVILPLCYPLFSQSYYVLFDDPGKPSTITLFDEGQPMSFNLGEASPEGTYDVEYNNRTLRLDPNSWRLQSHTDTFISEIDFYEPGLLPEGDLIHGLAYSTDGNTLAAMYQHSDDVFFYNTSTYQIKSIVDVGREPMDIAMTNQHAYVCCHSANELVVIDLDDYSISNIIDLPDNPCQVEINLEESIVYVGFESDEGGSVAAYDPVTSEQLFHTYEPHLYLSGISHSLGRDSYKFTDFSLSPLNNYFISIRTGTHKPAVFDALTGELVKTFNFGKMKGSGFSITGDTLYIHTVQSSDSMSIHRVNFSDFSVIDSIVAAVSSTFGIPPQHHIAINKDGSKALTIIGQSFNPFCLFNFNTGTHQILSDFSIMGLVEMYTMHDRTHAIPRVWGSFRCIDLETGEIVDRNPIGTSVGIAGAMSPVEDKLALGDGFLYSSLQFTKEKFYIFDLGDPANISTEATIISGIAPEADLTNSAVLSRDGKKIIASNVASDNISIVDFESGQLDTLIQFDRVSSIKTIYKRDQVLASGHDANFIKIIDLTNNETILELYTSWVDNVIISGDGNYAYVFEEINPSARIKKIVLDGAQSEILDEATVDFRCFCSYEDHSLDFVSPTFVGLSPDGNYLLFGSSNDTLGEMLNVFSTQHMEVVKTLPIHDNCVYDYAFTHDSKRVCAIQSDNILIIYLDSLDSYIENEITTGYRSYSSAYSPIDDYFYVLIENDSMYNDDWYLFKIDPLSGEIIEEIPIPESDYHQVEISKNGMPVIRGARSLWFNDMSYMLPGISQEMYYDGEFDLFVIPITGPDKIGVFSPLYLDSKIYPETKRTNIITVSPNPFSTSTVLSYDLPKPSTIRITIFNQLGKQVDHIQQSQSAGKQRINWNAEGLPSGMYYFTLQAGEQVATGKMVLMR